MASKLKGTGRVRRIIRQLPDAMRGQLAGVLERGGRALQAAMQAQAPSRTGALRAGISHRVLEKTLRLRVGLLGTKRGRAKLFYGRIQDLGRKEQVVLVQRRRRVGGGGTGNGILITSRGRKRAQDIVSTYRMRVPAMKGKRFVTGRFPEARETIQRELGGIWDKAINSIAGGTDD